MVGKHLSRQAIKPSLDQTYYPRKEDPLVFNVFQLSKNFKNRKNLNGLKCQAHFNKRNIDCILPFLYRMRTWIKLVRVG